MVMRRSLLVALALSMALCPALQAQAMFADVKYSLSIGLGGATILQPDEFEDNYNPAFGFLLDVGATMGWVEAVVDFDYSFFFRKGTVPDDINIFNMFLLVKIKPLASKARPYILAGGDTTGSGSST